MDNPIKSTEHAYPVRSLEKGLEVLALFRTADHAVRLTDISRQCGISVSTTHRMLRALQNLGYVQQDRTTRAYYAGAGLLNQAASLLHHGDLIRHARPELEALEARTLETAALCVLRGSEAQFIARVESRQSVHSATPPVNHIAPAHATSGGKLLLAHLAQQDLRKLFAKSRLFAPRSTTIATRTALERELRLIRDRGFATSLEEAHEDVCTVSTAIPGMRGVPLGALTLMCPRVRMPPSRIARLVEELSISCERIAARMSHHSNDPRPGTT
jgi:DNA-binding IclR family transcriptional regulator